MTETRRGTPRCGTGRAALAACLILSLLTQCFTASGADGSVSSDAGHRPLELILVPEQECWLLLAAAPVAGRLKETGRTPVLVAVSAEPTDDQRRLLSELLPSCNSCSVVSMSRTVEFSDLGKGPTRKQSVGGSNLLDTTLLLARNHWRRVNTVVLCLTRDPKLGILSAAMAAHMNVPFIACHGETDLKGIHRTLRELTVTKVLLVGNSNLPKLLSGIYEVEQLNATSLSARTLGLIGADGIRNIVLVRAPDIESEEGNSSWMAPYLSVMRRAPVVVCSSSAAKEAEDQVMDMARRHNLRPETITILADYNSIGTKSVSDNEYLGEYVVDIEPCLGPVSGRAVPFGVGRIPLADLADASRMVARTVAREVLLERKPASAVMIANPDTAYGSLPLAGAVSRITAEEFKNCGVEIAEFYGKGSSTPEIVEAATKAALIIYEGHISSQMLFHDPSQMYEYPEYDTEFYYSDDDTLAVDLSQEHLEEEQGLGLSHYADMSDESDSAAQEMYEDYLINDTGDDTSHVPVERLLAYPVVVLQSCHSLEEHTWRRIVEVGGVGLVGSVTNIHSASGSAFVKALCDGLLYRNQTIGEALRDARNYFLCLTALKKQRGHKETAKAYRVALSFRCWGDPEMRLFPQSQRARKGTVSAAFADSRAVKISTPRYRLPVVRNEKYFVRMFPGSQVAGVVRSLKNEPVRRIMPLYFFKLEKPAGFDAKHWTLGQIAGNSSERSVFLTDPLERFLYVLYFPDKEAKSDEFLLPFVE